MTNEKLSLLNVLQEKIPDLPVDDHTMVITQDYLIHSPSDWVDFVLMTVYRQCNGPNDYLITLGEQESTKAFNIMKEKAIPMYVLGHIVSEGPTIIWQVQALRSDKNKRVWLGGENLRKFCDYHNLYYGSMYDEKKNLLSSTDCLYLKKDSDDCRKPLNDEVMKWKKTH